MEDHVAYWFAAKNIAHTIACLIFYIVWKYSESKPLGQQTILDILIKDTIRIAVANFTFSNLIYIKFKDNYNHEETMGILTLTQSSMMAYLLQIMVTILIRYLYIFHPGFMHDKSDKNITRATRIFVGLGTLASPFLNDFGKGGPEYAYLMNDDKATEKDQGPARTFSLFRGVLILDILLLIGTQIRIEMFKKETKPKTVTITLKTNRRNRPRRRKNKHSVFGNKGVAITFVLLLIFLMLVLEFVFFPSNIGSAAKALQVRVVSNIIMNIMIPLVWIRKNKKLHDFFFRAFCSQEISLPIEMRIYNRIRGKKVQPLATI